MLSRFRRAGPLLCLAPVLAAAGPGATQASEPPSVVASIKPIHSLAAAVMAGVGTPGLLVEGAASPHSYSLRPSDAAKLDDATLVFWIGPAMETFLAKPLASLAADATVLEVEEIPGLVLLPPRQGGVWAPHAHDHEHEAHANEDAQGQHAEEERLDHEDDMVDAHLWLDPDNAKRIAVAMAETLAAADPDQAAVYRANAAALIARIDALDAELAAMLAPVRERPFVVFHDAYQYFETHYGLNAAGSITVSPDQPPGARRLAEIRAAVAARGAACVFREPQVEPAMVELAIEGSGARQGELDPEGATLDEGPDLYFELMRSLARNLAVCLGEG